MLRLLRLKFAKPAPTSGLGPGLTDRKPSPSRGSTLITSAPKSAKKWVSRSEHNSGEVHHLNSLQQAQHIFPAPWALLSLSAAMANPRQSIAGMLNANSAPVSYFLAPEKRPRLAKITAISSVDL